MGFIIPTGLLGARSPIYVTADYTTEAVSITDITLEVRIWDYSRSTVPVAADYTLFRDVFTGLQVSFDIAPFIREHIEGTWQGDVRRNAPRNAEASTVVWVQVAWEINYIDKGSPQQTQNRTGSTIFSASNGYHLFSEGANYEFPAGVMHPSNIFYVTEDGFELAGIHLGDWGAEEIESVLYTDAFGTTALTQVDITSFHSGVQPEDRIVQIPIGVLNCNTWLTSVNGFRDALAPDEDNNPSYQLALLNGSDVTVATIQVVKVCEPKYTIRRLDFINRYGTWQQLNCFKVSTETSNATSESYRKMLGSSSSSGYTYDIEAPQYQRFNANAKVSTTLNTGYVDESYSAVMEDLLVAERVMLDGKPVEVVTNSLKLQKGVNDKVMNYTIEVVNAFDSRYV